MFEKKCKEMVTSSTPLRFIDRLTELFKMVMGEDLNKEELMEKLDGVGMKELEGLIPHIGRLYKTYLDVHKKDNFKYWTSELVEYRNLIGYIYDALQGSPLVRYQAYVNLEYKPGCTKAAREILNSSVSIVDIK